jgi:hypothetical protein
MLNQIAAASGNPLRFNWVRLCSSLAARRGVAQAAKSEHDAARVAEATRTPTMKILPDPLDRDSSDHAAGFWDEVIGDREAGAFLNLSTRSIQRLGPDGPPFIRLTEKRKGYTRRMLVVWVRSRASVAA